MASFSGYIGQIKEIRVAPAHAEDITVRMSTRCAEVISQFLGRGPGNFKMACAETKDKVRELLSEQLQQWLDLKGVPDELMEMRIAFNTVEDGLTWEGFILRNSEWEPAVFGKGVKNVQDRTS